MVRLPKVRTDPNFEPLRALKPLFIEEIAQGRGSTRSIGAIPFAFFPCSSKRQDGPQREVSLWLGLKYKKCCGR
jgi:hypothetical protein